MFGGHVLKTWTKKQQVIATSSCESELYALTRAASEALGAQTLLADLGVAVGITVHIDSSAALSLAHREGLGRAKHISIQDLWIQQTVRDKRLTLAKISSTLNVADLGTKGLSKDRIDYLMRLLNHRFT